MDPRPIATLATLPPEIIGLLCRAGNPSDLLQTTRLSSVCAHWRNVVLGDALLWSDITMRVGPQDVQLLPVVLSRAGQVPLSLAISFAGSNYEDAVSVSMCLRTHATSVHALSLTFSHELPVLAEHIELPNLRILSLTTYSKKTGYLNLITPKLERLELDSLEETAFIGFTSLVGVHTTSISITFRLPLAVFDKMVRGAPSLVHLAVPGAVIARMHTNIEDPVHLSSLKTLVISDFSAFIILRMLATQHVNRIVVTGVWRDSISQLLDEMWPKGVPLTRFSVSLTGDDAWDMMLEGPTSISRSLHLDNELTPSNSFFHKAVTDKFSIQELTFIRLPLAMWPSYAAYCAHHAPPHAPLHVEVTVHGALLGIPRRYSQAGRVQFGPAIANLVISSTTGTASMTYATVPEILRIFQPPLQRVPISIIGVTVTNRKRGPVNDVAFVNQLLNDIGLRNWECVEIVPGRI